MKRWNFEKMTTWHFWKWVWGCFSKQFEKGSTFSNYFEKKGPFSNWVWKKKPTRGPGPGWTGARAQDPGPNRVGYFFKLSLKMDPFFKIVWKSTPFLKLFWKTPPDRFSKMSRSHFFKASLFHKGCKSIVKGYAMLSGCCELVSSPSTE